jgi:hypothetical protein
VSVTIVVVHLTRNRKNWAWIFLIFLRFSREFTISSKLDILLKLRFCTEAPRKIQPLTMWPRRPNSGGSGDGVGRGRVWGEVRAHLRPIYKLEWGRGAAGGAGSGTRRWPPWERCSRRRGRLCRATRDSGGCGGGSWCRGCAQTVVRWRGGEARRWRTD